MATTCSQVATLTTTEVVPTGSTFTTVTDVLTTMPDSTFTTSVANVTCTSFNETTSCFTTFVPTTRIIPGVETFTEVTITGIADNVFTTTRTLFDNVCTTIVGDPGTVSRPVSPKPGSDTTRPVGSPSPRTTPSITYPTSSASTTADAAISTSGAEKKSTPLGPIIGGAVGGVVVLAVVIWLGWKFFYKPMKAAKVHNDFWDGKEEMAFAAGAAGAAGGAGGAASGGQEVTQNPFCGGPQHAPVNANTGNANANSNTTNGNGNGPENQQQQQVQQQTDQNQNQWDHHKPHRLPKKAEEMLQEKMDEWMHGAPAAAAAGAAGALGSVAPGPYDPYQQQNYADNATVQPPSPLRPTSTGSFTSQPSFGTAGVGAFNQQNQQQQQQWSQAQPVSQGLWNTTAPYPAQQSQPQPQFNAPAGQPVLGQTVYTQQPFTPPPAQNYHGYAEPSK